MTLTSALKYRKCLQFHPEVHPHEKRSGLGSTDYLCAACGAKIDQTTFLSKHYADANTTKARECIKKKTHPHGWATSKRSEDKKGESSVKAKPRPFAAQLQKT